MYTLFLLKSNMKKDKKLEVRKIKTRHSSNMTYWVKNVNSRTTIVMLHGIGSSSSFATKVGRYETNFNIISLDLPGGKNGPKYPGLTIQAIAEKVSHFIKHHVRSRNIIIMGHSLGGAVAAHVANNTRKVDEVIYLSPFTPYLAKTKTYKVASNYMTLGDSKKDIAKKALLATAIKAVAKTFGFTNLGAFTDEESNEFTLLKNNVYKKSYIADELLNEYKSVRQPSFFMISEKDVVVGTEGVNKFAKSLGKEVIIIEGTDHNPFVSSAKKIVDILNEKYKFEKRLFGRKIIEL